MSFWPPHQNCLFSSTGGQKGKYRHEGWTPVSWRGKERWGLEPAASTACCKQHTAGHREGLQTLGPSQGRAGPSPGSHQADRRKQYLLLWKGGLGKHQAATMSLLWKAVGKPNLNLSWSCVAGCVGVRELANRLDERRRSPWGDTSRGVVITVWFPWYCMQIISVQQSWTQDRANNRIQTAIARCDQGPCYEITNVPPKRAGSTSEGSFSHRTKVSWVQFWQPWQAQSPRVSLSSSQASTTRSWRAGELQNENGTRFFLSVTGTVQQIREPIKSDREEPSPNVVKTKFKGVILNKNRKQAKSHDD